MLSITSVTRENGAACNHLIVAVDQEGTPRTFKTSFSEIDALFARLSVLEQAQLLVTLWAKYRRSQGRAITGVEIA